MRQRRAKTYRKLLSLYMRHFKFRLPLQLLLDSSFLLTLAKQNLSDVATLQKRLADVLQVASVAGSNPSARARAEESVKLMVTQCSIVELYKSEKESDVHARAVKLAKGFERRKCNHKDAIPGDDCIKSVLGPTNKHRYVIGTDSKPLRAHIRNEIVGVPVVHSNERGVLVMEPMSDKTEQRVRELEDAKLGISPAEAAQLGLAKPEASAAPAAAPNVVDHAAVPGASAQQTPGQALFVPKRKKKAKGPNPLSVRKPKRKEGPQGANAVKVGQKRKRGGDEAKGGTKKVKEGGSAGAKAKAAAE